MKIYTRRGDGGETGLLYGGRVRKNAPGPVAYGAVDEAQAFLGFARSLAAPDSHMAAILLDLCRDLYVAMAELATGEQSRARLVDETTLVTEGMVRRLEATIDDVSAQFEPPREFVIPGGTTLSASLDVARTVVRRAERESIPAAAEGSHVLPYLNRLSDLLWALARWAEGKSTPARLSDPVIPS